MNLSGVKIPIANLANLSVTLKYTAPVNTVAPVQDFFFFAIYFKIHCSVLELKTNDV